MDNLGQGRAALQSKDKLEKIHPWITISTAEVQARIDLRLSAVPTSSGRAFVAHEDLSIRSALLEVLQTEDRQDEANGILEESSLCDVFRPFLEKEPEWDVVCSVTDSMVSGSWGLKSFIIGDRGYLYYEPVWGVGDDKGECLPIIAAWEPVKDAQAFRVCFLLAYERNWQDFCLPPMMGQWASGPRDIMLEAITNALRLAPDWSAVVERLRKDKNSQSFEEIALAVVEETGEPAESVSRILRPYYELNEAAQNQRPLFIDGEGEEIACTFELEGRGAVADSGGFSELESRILVAAFLFIIGERCF
jgi:hypothetical protein